MIKKLTISLGVIIAFCLIIVKINPDFTFQGLLIKLEQFPNLLSDITKVKFLNAPQYPVPDVTGFKTLVKGVNSVITALWSLADYSLATIKVVPNLLRALLDVVTYIFGF